MVKGDKECVVGWNVITYSNLISGFHIQCYHTTEGNTYDYDLMFIFYVELKEIRGGDR